MIPKVIHIGWYQGFDKLPEKYNIYVESWKKHNPQFKIEYWDNDRFMREASSSRWHPEIFEKYTKVKAQKSTFAFKIDIIKLFALHMYGGFWVDTDCMCVNSIEKCFSLNQTKVHFCRLLCKGVVSNYVLNHTPDIWCIASPKGTETPYWDKTCNYMIERNKQSFEYFTMSEMCKDPEYYCYIHRKYNGMYSSVFADNLCVRDERQVTPETFCYHSFDGTWLVGNDLKTTVVSISRDTHVLTYVAIFAYILFIYCVGSRFSKSCIKC